jgi:hypothetical protein
LGDVIDHVFLFHRIVNECPRLPEEVFEQAKMDDGIMLGRGHKDALVRQGVYSPIGMVIPIAEKKEIVIVVFMIFDILD